MSAIRKVVAAFALLFFFAPLLLWAGGLRARPFENRPMAPAPKLSEGWDVFDGATRFFVDRLPLREQAVRANTWASEHVFDTTPDYSVAARDALPFGEQPAQEPEASATPQNQPAQVKVYEGRDGWLFLQGELVRACSEFAPWKTVMRRYERLVQMIRASGRDVVFVVPPDKSAIYPEYVPTDGVAERDCWKRGHRRAWAAIEGSRSPDILPLRKAMLAAKAAPPEELFHPGDTHWNSKGATLAARALLAELGAPPMAGRDIRRSRADYVGDLTGLVGAPEARDAPVWQVSRRGLAKPETSTEGVVEVRRHRAGGPPQLPGRTVFVYDSFGYALQAAFQPYLRETASVLWYGPKPKELIDAIVSGDTVILEKVERDLNFLASDQGIVTSKFLRDLERALRRDG